MEQIYYDIIEANPVIAAVKDEEGLADCCHLEDIKVVFILYGNICSIQRIVKKVKEAGKLAFVHVDLITGLSAKDISVDFISESTEADGIISTKPSLIKRGRELKLLTVLRVFVLDSMAFENLNFEMRTARPDMVEILPGLMPKIIRKVRNMVKAPVIAGGLISDKEDVVAALAAGAISVTTTNRQTWLM